VGIFPERAKKEERSKSMTENNRLTTITTPMYQDASTTTLNEFIEHAKRQFSERVIALYETAKDTNVRDFTTNVEESEYKATVKAITKSLHSVDFYEQFWYAGQKMNRWLKFPVYHFRVNPKNINFETTLTNLRQEFANELGVDEVCQSPEPPIRMIKNIPDWEKLFGTGEFPFMSIYVFRLGNTEYFAYDIHR